MWWDWHYRLRRAYWTNPTGKSVWNIGVRYLAQESQNTWREICASTGVTAVNPTQTTLRMYITHNPALFLVLPHKTGCLTVPISNVTMQSNLGSWMPQIMNNSVYEQISRTQSVSDDVLCLELRTREPSTSRGDKLGVSASAVFVEEWSSGRDRKKNPLPNNNISLPHHLPLSRQLSSIQVR